MAIISERDELADDSEPAPWDERPIVGTSRGLSWWGAILLGFGLTIFGAAVDIQLNDKPTVLFQGTYFVSCVAAVCWTRRKNLFAPMVQPPLILAIVLPLIVIYGSGLPENFELKDAVLTYGLPVINGFPTMAITTVATLLIGVFRIFRERDPDHDLDADHDADERPVRKRRRGAAADDADDVEVANAAAPTRTVRPTAARAQPPAGTRAPRAGRESAPTRRPIDPAAPRRARADDNRARPLEGEPRPMRRPGVERQAPGKSAQPPGQPPVPPRRRAPGEPPRKPPGGAQPPRRQPGEPLPPRRPPRRQPPPPRPRPWDTDDRG